MSSAQRIAVWEGRKEKTSGGLRKGDLIKNRQGRIVSKKKSAVAKRLNNLGSHLRGKKKAEPKKAEPKKATKKAAKKKVSKPVEDEEYVDDEVREKKRKKPKKGYASTNVDVANIVVGRRRRRKPRGSRACDRPTPRGSVRGWPGRGAITCEELAALAESIRRATPAKS